MQTVYCPVKGNQTDSTDCITVCDVVDGLLNSSVLYDGKPGESILPKSTIWDEEQRQKCLNCKYHFGTGEYYNG